MKVSFIIKSHLSDDGASLIGGASKNPYRLVKYLSREISIPRVVYFDGTHSGSESYKAAGSIVKGLKLYARTIAQNFVSSVAVWTAFRESDVVQCHHPHYGLVAAVLKRYVFRNVKFVVKAHGTALPELRANRYLGVKGKILAINSWIHLWHDRFVLSKADAVLCSSEFQRNEMISIYGIPARLIHCIYNGYDGDYLSFTPESIQRPRIQKYFVFCGRVVPKKGIAYAIELFERVAAQDDSFRLSLVLGRKREIEDTELYRKILGIVASDHRIHIKHDLSEQELYAEFCSASVGLVTSENYESLPTVVVEMLAAGLPVFAKYLWGIPEVLPVEFSLTGKIEEDTRKIRDYMKIDKEFDPITPAVVRIRDQFNYPNLTKSYLALYQSLLFGASEAADGRASEFTQ